MELNNLKPEMKQCSIVLIGDFNPAMFSPEWFGKNGVIAPEDVDFALNPKSNPISSSAITIFQTRQLNIKIDAKRFQVISNNESFVIMRDFIINTFENLSNYTILAFGLNYSAHYKIESMQVYHRIGDLLAPKKYWKSLLGDDVDGDNRKGGLATIQMQELKHNSNGQISVILQPSNMLSPGLFLSCNDHTNLNNEDSSAERLVEMISDGFEESYLKMKNLQLSVLGEVINEK